MQNSFSKESQSKSLLQQLFNKVEFKIAAKAGIAATLSYIAGTLFSEILEHPNPSISASWAVLSTFVVLQAHLGGTYRAAWIRFLGTAVGAFSGALFAGLFGFHVVTLGISIFLTVILCSLLNLKDSIRIACMSTSIVMILWALRPTISPWTFGLFRFLDSSIGILVAVFVAHAFWPAQALTQLRENLANTATMLRRQYRLAVKIAPEPKQYGALYHRIHKVISDLLVQNRNILEDSKLEILSRSSRLEEWSSLIDQLESIFNSLTVLETFRDSPIADIFDETLQNQLTDTLQQTDKGLQQLTKIIRGDLSPTFDDLERSVEKLNEELIRFRTTKKTRQWQRAEVEKFFVYFYNLRDVIEEILRIERRCRKISERESDYPETVG